MLFSVNWWVSLFQLFFNRGVLFVRFLLENVPAVMFFLFFLIGRSSLSYFQFFVSSNFFCRQSIPVAAFGLLVW